MNLENLEVLIRDIIEAGPARVVINESGEATTPERAERDYAVKPTVIYVRDDGWSLGAPPGLSTVACNLWLDVWVAVMFYHRDGKFWSWKPLESKGG